MSLASSRMARSDRAGGELRDDGVMEDRMENRDLVLDLVEWVAERPPAYRDLMDAWRSSCPRLTIRLMRPDWVTVHFPFLN